jgi:capsid protein
MSFLGFATTKEIKKLEDELITARSFSGTYKPIMTLSFDGEKDTGELGPIIDYDLDYQGLRYRSWESYLSSEITQTVVNKYITWIIGSGLKLQSEPVKLVLESEKIDLDTSKFSKEVEARFKLYAKSRSSDHSKIENINRIARTVYTNAIVGGDVLVVQRVVKGILNIQLIDGANVMTPNFNDARANAIDKGNDIKNGIEENKAGEHIAFHVQKKDGEFIRIPAKGIKTGRENAYMVYGLRYRINDNRGIPLISTVLETLKKLDRYKEATVGSAEERAKIPYFIKHGSTSTGENPLTKTMAQAFNIDSDQEIPVDINGQQLADKVAVSTNKTVFNMPQDSELVSLDTKNDIYFKEFYSVNVNAICAAIGIPPEVALSKYDSNFSASRAALKDWEHTIKVQREGFSFQYYEKIYITWLELEILKQKVQAPGYLLALSSGDEILLGAFRNARFVGTNVPHIDPLKEVQAERLKLGSAAAHLPLTTAEASTELLGSGDYDTNVIQFADEVDDADDKGIVDPKIVLEETKQQNTSNPNNNGK